MDEKLHFWETFTCIARFLGWGKLGLEKVTSGFPWDLTNGVRSKCWIHAKILYVYFIQIYLLSTITAKWRFKQILDVTNKRCDSTLWHQQFHNIWVLDISYISTMSVCRSSCLSRKKWFFINKHISASPGLESNFEGESSLESLMPSSRGGEFWNSIILNIKITWITPSFDHLVETYSCLSYSQVCEFLLNIKSWLSYLPKLDIHCIHSKEPLLKYFKIQYKILLR